MQRKMTEMEKKILRNIKRGVIETVYFYTLIRFLLDKYFYQSQAHSVTKRKLSFSISFCYMPKGHTLKRNTTRLSTSLTYYGFVLYFRFYIFDDYLILYCLILDPIYSNN